MKDISNALSFAFMCICVLFVHTFKAFQFLVGYYVTLLKMRQVYTLKIITSVSIRITSPFLKELKNPFEENWVLLLDVFPIVFLSQILIF